MKDTDEDFNNIIDANAEYEADKLLDKQLHRIREWIERKEALGEKPTLRALTREILPEHRKRIATVALLAAALWRLLQKEDGQ